MNLARIHSDPRWKRLLQPAAEPFGPEATLGSEIHVADVIAQMNDVARILELVALPPFLVGVLFDGRERAAAGTWFADNVFRWSETGDFHAPRSFRGSWQRHPPASGLLVSPILMTLDKLGDVWSWLVLDRARGVVHRIDPDPAAKPTLDRALGAFLAGLGVGLAYHAPEPGEAPWRALLRDTLLPVPMPADIKVNVWSYWLLYARLFFSDATHEEVFGALPGRLWPHVRVANLLLNFYGSFSVDANVHTFGSLDFIRQHGAAEDLSRYEALIGARVRKLGGVGSSRAQLGQLVCAALGDFIRAEEDAYRRLYQRYVTVPPPYVPNGQDAGGWIPEEAIGPRVRAVLGRGELRFGHFNAPPYLCPNETGELPPDGELNGLDWEIGQRVTARILARYPALCPGGLTARWVDVKPGVPAPDEGQKFYDLYQGLSEGRYDVAMSGQLWLPPEHTTGTRPDWTCATTVMVTNITYTGLGELGLEDLVGASRAAFVEAVAAISRERGLVLTFFSVVNPGPSPTSAKNLVTDVIEAGGMARWVHGEVSESSAYLRDRLSHFVVGDGIANGWQCRTLLHATGRYLNIPAAREVTPYATATSELTLLHQAAFTLVDAEDACPS